MHNPILKYLLIGITAVSICLGTVAPFGAQTIDGVEYVEYTITAEQLYAMFEAGDIQVVFGASSFYDIGESSTKVSLLDGTLSTVRDVSDGDFLTQAATTCVSHSEDNIDFAYFYAPYLFNFSGEDVSSNDGDTVIYDSGDYSINIVIPFEGIYNASSILLRFFGWREYTDSVVYDSDATVSWRLLNDDVRVTYGSSIFAEVSNTTWASDWGLNWFYTNVITNTSSIPVTSNISTFSGELMPNSASELCNRFQIDINAYKYITVENIAYIPLIFGIDSFTVLVPDVPVDPEDPDTPVDPEDPDTPVDPEDPDTPTYADMVGEYLDAITNPSPEAQAAAQKIHDDLKASADRLKYQVDILQRNPPYLEDYFDELPDIGLEGVNHVVSLIFHFLENELVEIILACGFIIITFKLILYGRG